MFTIHQIEQAHDKVKSGADFPNYAQELVKLGITGYSTYVADGHTIYLGKNDFHLNTDAIYPELKVSAKADIDGLKQTLKIHRQGQTDYLTFCKQVADAGVEKWVIDLKKMTCSYADTAGNLMVVEQIPTA